jgi:prepilin-type N-terminal cleavage/methylation domain-containing protein
MVIPRRAQAGFTLIETLVALAVITAISMVVLGALAPWVGFKQSVDTERKLQDLKQGFIAYYDSNAMAIEAQGNGNFGPFVRSTPDANGSCADQADAFAQISGSFSESPQQLAKDGYANPWCVLISDALSQSRDGVKLWYRNIAFVSTGRDGKLDAGTRIDALGNLVTGGDDSAMVLPGYDLEYAKLKETQRRMSRVASMYETYFTTRFLAYPDRDITRYYFANGGAGYDTSGAVASTGGNWSAVATALAGIGVAAVDAVTPWEQFNNIEVGNFSESVNGVTVRSPQTSGTGALPYTALLRARLPAPAGQTVYATQVVVGNY